MSLLLTTPRGIPVPNAAGQTRSGTKPGEPLRSYVAFLDLKPIYHATPKSHRGRQSQKIAGVVEQAARMLITDKDAFALHQNAVCIVTFGDSTLDIATNNTAAIGHKIVRSLLGRDGVGRITLEPVVFPLHELLRHGIPPMAAPAVPTVSVSKHPAAKQRAIGAETNRTEKLLQICQELKSSAITPSYHPIWNSESKMVQNFLLMPYRKHGAVGPTVGYDMLVRNRTDGDLIAFDTKNFETGLLALKQALDAGHRSRLVLPLHFTTVGSNQGRAGLMEILPSLPAIFREYMSFFLYGIPSGIPQGRLHQVFCTLKPHVREVAAVLELAGESGLALWNLAARIRSVGIPRICIAMPAESQGDVFDKALSICSRATSLSLKVTTLGLRQGNHAHRLSVAGCTDFSGQLFGEPIPKLTAPYAVHPNVFEQGY